MKMLKKTLAMLLALIMVLGLVACGAAEEKPAETQAPAQAGEAAAPEAETPADPVKISLYYSDDATYPFREDWLALTETAKLANAEVSVEAIPAGEYGTPVSLALNTQENCPDVIMFQEIYGEKASLCLNGAVVAISDYPEWTPNFNAMVEKMGLTDQANALKLMDGKRYIMPMLHESLDYSGGLILRADFLEAKGFDAPKTFDDLYEILKAYKEENPDSYPMVHYLAPYITHRMIMPAWGCPVGYWVAPYLGSIAWDYENKDYYITATSDVYREYLQFMNKLYEEGLLDPEASDNDVWSQKMTSGDAICTYAYYDQIAGLEAASEIEGYDLNLYLPLEGPAGAYGENRGQCYRGLLFPATTAEREDFEQVVRAVDKMFYSEEAAKIWSIGVEGVTYNVVDGKIEFIDEIKNAPEGINKYMQVNYGCGTSSFQSVWPDEYTLMKNDPEFAEIYAAAAAMGANQPYAPEPWFDVYAAEEAGMIGNGAMFDLVETCREQFIAGDLDVNDDAAWAKYVADMEGAGLNEYLKLYSDNRNKG